MKGVIESMSKKRLFLLGIIVLAACMASVLYASGTWNILLERDPEIRDYFAITFVSPKEGWVAGDAPLDMDSPGYIGHTKDGGKSWEKAEVRIDKTLSDIYFVDKKNGWAVGDAGMIVGTNDGGKCWNIQASKVDNWLYGVHFVNAKTGYAVGKGETVLQTKNGKSWKLLRGGEIPSGVGDEPEGVFYAVHFIDELTGWAAGIFVDPTADTQNSTIKKTTDGGQTWVDQPTNTEISLRDIFFVDASNGWAVGDDGLVLHTTNGGDTWKIQASGTEEKLLSVSFADKNVGWAVGGDTGVSVIIHTTDGGETWEMQPIEHTRISKVPANGVCVLDADKVWVTGNNGFVASYSK